MMIGTMRVLGYVIVAPHQAWDKINQRGQWVWPLMLLAIATIAAWSTYYSRVDIAWLQNHLLAESSDLKGRELTLARELVGRRLLAMVTIVSSLAASVTVMLLTAGYLSLVARVQRVSHVGSSWLVFSAWLTLPESCALLLTTLRVASDSNQQILPESANPLALSQLLGLGVDSPWLSLAADIGLQTLWALTLCVIGVSRWMKINLFRAVLIANLPLLLIYGPWALLILAGTSL